MSKNPPHSLATRQLYLALSRLVPAGWHVQNQEPLTLETSEPELDIAIVRGELTDCPNRSVAQQRNVVGASWCGHRKFSDNRFRKLGWSAKALAGQTLR